MITIIYGPPRNGNKKNIEEFKKHFLASNVIEDWNGDINSLKDGDLVFTNNVVVCKNILLMNMNDAFKEMKK